MKQTEINRKASQDPFEDLEFANRLLKQAASVETDGHVLTIQGIIRTIVKNFGYDLSKYPTHTRYAFWTLATGDAYGSFKRTLFENLEAGTDFDERNPDVVKYRC